MDGRVGRPVGKIEINLNNPKKTIQEFSHLCRNPRLQQNAKIISHALLEVSNDCNFSPVVLCYNCNSKLKIHTHITKYKLNAIIVVISLNIAKVWHQIVIFTRVSYTHFFL